MISVNNEQHWLIEKSVKQPNKKTVITSDRIITYQDLVDECLNDADFFISKGIQKNDHVGILFDHRYKFYVVINALWFIGAVPIPLNTRLLPEELEIQIEQANIKWLLIDENLSKQFSQINFQNKIHFSKIPRNETRNNRSEILNYKFSIINSALIMFTSGSTGKPKAVVHTFESLFESVRAIDSYAHLTGNDIWLASLPLYHIGGFMILVRALITGSSIAFPVSLDYKNIIRIIQESLPTHISIVPTTLARLLDENIRPSTNLKFVFLGGGPSEKEFILKAYDKGWPIIKVYGSTETCSMVTTLPTNVLKEKPDSAGKVLENNKIKIKSLSSDDPAGIGEVGEIIVSAGSLFKEYHNDYELTKERIRDGWFYTGDFGWMDEKGFLFVETRREDLIITGGENVSAYEVETVIKTYPTVKDAFVFGLQDKNWGQIVCAVIVSDNYAEDEIKEYLKTKIAGFKIPKRFFLIDKIPRHEMGKVIRSVILKQLNLD
ncbi:MAG: o-succinylbenzoate--CoA ligase [Ignavibacteriales bacterium]|nr:o-succinylbenzoate--CoA ligase [Ignavibacteriales bacterium]